MEKSRNRRLNKLRKKISELFLLGGLSEEEVQAIEEAELATSSRKLASARYQRQPGPQLTLTLERLGGVLISHAEVRELVQYTVIGPLVGKPKWAHFRPWKSTSQTVVIRVDIPNEYLAKFLCKEDNGFSFPFVESFFEKQWIRMDSAVKDRESFWDHLMKVPRIDPLEGLGKCAGLKTELLITTPEMVENGYPFPDDSIIPTKDKYATVTRDSPVFALDCEMCVTSAGHHELTRISINYLTKFSGITPELMESVTTSLEDVQAAIRSILPPDGILCGHSLEFDLHSMRMAHPYCIDIGLIYNLSGTARNKTSLKNLMAVFFDEEIQIVRAAARFGLIIVVMSSEKSSICYLKVKH
uniref:Exonuclease domain-containing protein n=1 Tax=Angiostrongylus cantonensis TaxID=6313 RepID=A0A158P754_ANGCA